MFLSLVRPERISSPITRIDAVTGEAASDISDTPGIQGFSPLHPAAQGRETARSVQNAPCPGRNDGSGRLTLEDQVHAGPLDQFVSPRNQQANQVYLPATGAVLDNEQGRKHRLGRVGEEGL